MVLNLVNWKMLTVDEKKIHLQPTLSDWGNCIDPNVYQTISFYYEWMTTIPSFDIIIEAFNNKKQTNIITIHEENKEWTCDILINNSAATFKVKLQNFFDNWIKAYKVWKLFKEFLKKYGQFRNEIQQELDGLVN